MTLKRPTQAARLDDLDRAEARLSRTVDRSMRRWLARITAAMRSGVGEVPPSSLVAAAGPAPEWPMTLGTLSQWWAAEVTGDVASTIRQVWFNGYVSTRSGVVTSSSLAGLDLYMTAVSDRLVKGISPPLPDAAMNQVRISVTQAAAEGWATSELSEDIARRLSWETDGAYWRTQHARYGREIDAILDPLGPPGNPAREAARTHDPRVRELQGYRADARKHLDAEQSVWQTRADRIARTESTGAYNAATLAAYGDEGVEFKEWVATRDSRTRDSHVAADGQIVPVDQPFIVGNASIMFPGSPGGPGEEVVNCRCTTVGLLPDEVPPSVRASAGL